MLDPIVIEAGLTKETWSLYRRMRDDMVVWMDGQVSVSKQAIVKVLRLTQMISGFLGGLEDDIDEESPLTGEEISALPDYLKQQFPDVAKLVPIAPSTIIKPPPVTVREIGREKLDATLQWLKGNTPRKAVIWSRFKPEVTRTIANLKMTFPKMEVHALRGGQSKDERKTTKRFLAPGGDPAPGFVVGNTQAGGASLNFSAAPLMIFLSRSPALIQRTQAIGRIERPGATEPMLIVDVVAVGPKGQKTVDHHILKALRNKDDLARWTVNEWRRILTEE